MTDLRGRTIRWGLVTITAAAVAGLSGTAALAATPGGAAKTVTYRGYSFTIPANWPVIRTSASSTTCVRFDRHALYLGEPGRNQRCHNALLGTTEAILVQPAGATAGASAAQDATARQITVVSPRIKVTATYAGDQTAVTQILASASLPLPPVSLKTASPGFALSRVAETPAQQLVTPPAAASTVPASAVSFTGQGFDACTAPSSAFMSAWKAASPYGAVGIYIGGAERACDQPNLTADWVTQQAAAGWHFLPTYVGVQAEFGQITSPASQAVAAAKDAVTKAKALGFGPGNLIYYDMEAFGSGQETNVLNFLSAWTKQIHAEGYKSGVYSSSASGIVDLSRNASKYTMPDAIWDALWNGAANTNDPAIPANHWDHKQRAHQYVGGANATYGGHTVNIDEDYLNIGV